MSNSFNLTMRSIYRDGQYVVVDLANYDLGNACLVSGVAPVDKQPAIFTVANWNIGAKPIENLKDVHKGSWTNGPLRVSYLSLQVPRASEHQRFGSRWGLGVSFLILLLTIAGVIAAVWYVWQQPFQRSMWIVTVPIALGLFATLGTSIWEYRQQWPLRIVRQQDSFVWLAGVHPEVLERLAPWNQTGQAVALAQKNLLTSVAIAVISLLACVGLSIYSFEAIRDALESSRWLETPASIVSSNVKSRKIDGGKNANRRTVYEIEAQYSYVVGGNQYTSSRLSFGRARRYSSQASANSELKQRFAVGTAVKAYYSAGSPERATLARATATEILILSIPVGIALMIFVAFSCRSLLLLSRNNWQFFIAR